MNPTFTSNWRAETSLPVPIFNGQLIQRGQNLMYIGGQDDRDILGVPEIAIAKIFSDGTLSRWDIRNCALPSAHNFTRAVIANDIVAVLGQPSSSTYFSTSLFLGGVNDAGVVGPWAHSMVPGDAAGFARFCAVNLAYQDLIVLVGFCGGGATFGGNQVWSARLNENKRLNWKLNSQLLPEVINYSMGAVYGNYIYNIGGSTNGAGTAAGSHNKIYGARLEVDGSTGPWKLVGNLPVAMFKAATVVYGDKLIVIGGQNTSSVNLGTVYVARLERDGSIGPFTSEPLGVPVAGRYIGAAIVGNRLYIAGGAGASVKTNTVWSISLG